jgi:NAD(P)H-nitrite reductase large subunit
VTGGRKLDADLIVVATGIQPNINLAGDAGLDVSKGIVVNSLLQTTDPEIYAAGDAVETADIITGESILSGTWTDAVVMGRVAGTNISGGNLGYPGSLAVQNALEVAGVPTVSVGMIEPPDVREYEVLAERRGNTYRKLVLKNGRLVGALMVGEIEGSGIYTGLIKRRANVGPHMESLLARRPSSAAWLKLGDPVQASR